MTDRYLALDRNECAHDPIETAERLDAMGDRDSMHVGKSLHDAADVVRWMFGDLVVLRTKLANAETALATEKTRHGNEELLRAVQVASEARDDMARRLSMLVTAVCGEHAALDSYERIRKLGGRADVLDMGARSVKIAVATTRAVLVSLRSPPAGGAAAFTAGDSESPLVDAIGDERTCQWGENCTALATSARRVRRSGLPYYVCAEHAAIGEARGTFEVVAAAAPNAAKAVDRG